MNGISIAKGQAGTFEIVVLESAGNGQAISALATAAVDAAETAIPVERLAQALSDEDMLLIGDEKSQMVVQVDGAHVAGLEELTVEALPFAIRNGDVMRKLQNLSHSYEMAVLVNPEDTTEQAVLHFSGAAVATADQSLTTGRGRLRISYVKADTLDDDVDVPEGLYFGAVWDVESGSQSPLWSGEVEITSRWVQP